MKLLTIFLASQPLGLPQGFGEQTTVTKSQWPPHGEPYKAFNNSRSHDSVSYLLALGSGGSKQLGDRKEEVQTGSEGQSHRSPSWASASALVFWAICRSLENSTPEHLSGALVVEPFSNGSKGFCKTGKPVCYHLRLT